MYPYKEYFDTYKEYDGFWIERVWVRNSKFWIHNIEIY